MAQSSRLEKVSGKEEDAESRREAEPKSPNSRFKDLTRRLINVPREELLAKEEEWKDQKT
jgi:hypothetical protein